MSDSTFTLADLEKWVEKGLMDPEQIIKIRSYLAAEASISPTGIEQRKGLNLVSIACYFGAFMIILAYTVFIAMRWESLLPYEQVLISFLTILALWGLGYFLTRSGFRTAGHLLIFAGTGMAPLLVYSIQNAAGLWDPVGPFYQRATKTWLLLDLISLSVALIALWRTRFPLIVLLAAFWTWYLSMDITRLISMSRDSWEWGQNIQIASTLIGLGMLALGIFLQRNSKQAYSFWLYLSGHSLILAHLSWLTFDRAGTLDLVSPLGLVYIAAYLAFVIASVWLQRRVFLVFGALGCYAYLSYLAFNVFDGALGFVFTLGSMGLLIVLTAVGYQKYARHWLEQRLARQHHLSDS